MTKELFEDIEKMKQGQKKEITSPLLSVAQKIIQNRDENIEINRVHKASLGQRLETTLKPKISAISILKTIFSLRPQNLMTYGSVIAVVALVILLTGFTPEPKIELAPMKDEPVFEALRMEQEILVGVGGGIEEQTPATPETEEQKQKMPADYDIALAIIAGFGMLLLVMGIVRFYKGRKSQID